jgi:hypothetical protein
MPGLGRLMLGLLTVAGSSPSGAEPGEKAATGGRMEALAVNNLIYFLWKFLILGLLFSGRGPVMACLVPCLHSSAKVLIAKHKFKCIFSKTVTKIQCLFMHIIQNHINYFTSFLWSWIGEVSIGNSFRCGPSCPSVETRESGFQVSGCGYCCVGTSRGNH